MAILSAETLAGDLKTQVPSPRCNAGLETSGQDSYSSYQSNCISVRKYSGAGGCLYFTQISVCRKKLFFKKIRNLHKNVRNKIWGVYIKLYCMGQRKSRLMLLKE